MNETSSKTSYTIIGFILLLIIAGGVIWIIFAGWGVFLKLSDVAKAGIIVAALGLVGTLLATYLTKVKDRQMQRDAAHIEKKQTMYTDFINAMFEMITDSAKWGDEDYSAEMRKKFMANSLLWSNEDVLNKYHAFRVHSQKDPANTKQIWDDLCRLFLAFRKDIGLSNKNIDESTVLEILFDQSDIEAWKKSNKK